MNADSKAAIYWAMLRHWAAMAGGHSYWHQPQGVGSQFVPGVLAGYFNDLTAKTSWRGPVDNEGLPLVRVRGKLLYFPVTLLQKGMGHWDLWLKSERQDRDHFERFRRIANWAVANRDERGGWRLPLAEGRSASPYSAMIQGQATSLLCRAAVSMGRIEYQSAALRAAELMITPAAGGGPARYTAHGLVLDEVPLFPPRVIWNGWIFALFGLYDVTLLQDSSAFREALASTLAALVSLLPAFDARYWSYYDSAGALASPFYHRLHIAQLRALQKSFPQWSTPFAEMANHFERCLRSTGRRVIVTMAKGCQKIFEPPAVIIE
ncbi:MAG: D-glucuronyl C5-epimerase family protein [Chlamydiota bacterium]